MKREQHEAESMELFGKPFSEVHTWLDFYAGTPGYGMRHRRVRHHLEGIKLVVELFGEEVRDAARRHIESDLKEEGWVPGKDPFPRNESEYVKMGLF